MCLESKRLFPKIAKKDIIVGKKLFVNDGELVTYFREYPVTNVLMKVNFLLLTIIKLFLHGKDRHGNYIIEGGVIHSYNLSNSSTQFKYSFIRGEIDICTIYVKAVIPKGALYYEDWNGLTYASNKLILMPTEEQLKYFK